VSAAALPGFTAVGANSRKGETPISDALLKTWFISRSRRGAPPPVAPNNDVTAYIHYVDYYAAVGDAIAAVGSAGHVLMAGWDFDRETPVGSSHPQDRIGDLLKRVAAAGAHVRVMLSGDLNLKNAPMVAWFNQQPGCRAILDDRLRLVGTFHQKSVVVLGQSGPMAFLGGMDLSKDRLADPATKRAPWHDVQVRLRGPAAADVWATLASRWESYPKSDRLPSAPVSGGARQTSGCGVQVVRTYGNPTTDVLLNLLHAAIDVPRDPGQIGPSSVNWSDQFAFAPIGESSIHDLMVQAIRATRESIYVEDQYFVACQSIGGTAELLQALADTIARPTFKHMLVLTTGVGTVQGELYQTNRRRRELVDHIAAQFPGKISVWAYKGDDHVYWLHAKTWIFDDTMAIIGSANFNRRGLSHDGELGVGIIDLDRPGRGGWVHQLRVDLWLKHLSTPKRPVTKGQVADFQAGRVFWVDTPETYQFPMNIAAGDPRQPDHLILCDDSEKADATATERFLRACACNKWSPLSRHTPNNYDNQWNFVIDPDGS
jgi:phosphatidylserine/phosphatidylglycerophosphate/cardiolipin synthase-like enzyme